MKSSAGLLISDWHKGEVILPHQVDFLNEYNSDIANARLDFTIENTIHLLTDHVGRVELDEFHLCLNGDLISGIRHIEHEETNDLTLMQQVEETAKQIADAVGKMALFCKMNGIRLIVHCTGGNHANIGEHRSKNPNGQNLDLLACRMAYSQLGRHNTDYGIEWQFADGLWTEFEMSGRLFRLMHGHIPGSKSSARGDGALGPAGPIVRLRAKMFRQATSTPRRPFDTLLIGHYHHYYATDEVIGNGCIVGYNEYAIALGFPYQEPVQALWVTHPKYGITHQMKVHCDA